MVEVYIILILALGIVAMGAFLVWNAEKQRQANKELSEILARYHGQALDANAEIRSVLERMIPNPSPPPSADYVRQQEEITWGQTVSEEASGPPRRRRVS